MNKMGRIPMAPFARAQGVLATNFDDLIQIGRLDHGKAGKRCTQICDAAFGDFGSPVPGTDGDDLGFYRRH